MARFATDVAFFIATAESSFVFDFDPRDLLKRESWDASAVMLVAGNAMALAFALVQGMDPASVVWAYWLESMIIGGYTILTFLTIALRSATKNTWSGAAGSAGMGAFFAVHYGMFHAGYFLFLYILPWFTPDWAELPDILVLAGLFVLTHGYSFVTNFLRNPKRLESTQENLNDVMMAPYGRIIPMHLAIILSGFVIGPLTAVFLTGEEVGAWDGSGAGYAAKMGGLLVFMALKTLADVAGHIGRYKKGAAKAG